MLKSILGRTKLKSEKKTPPINFLLQDTALIFFPFICSPSCLQRKTICLVSWTHQSHIEMKEGNTFFCHYTAVCTPSGGSLASSYFSSFWVSDPSGRMDVGTQMYSSSTISPCQINLPEHRERERMSLALIVFWPLSIYKWFWNCNQFQNSELFLMAIIILTENEMKPKFVMAMGTLYPLGNTIIKIMTNLLSNTYTGAILLKGGVSDFEVGTFHQVLHQLPIKYLLKEKTQVFVLPWKQEKKTNDVDEEHPTMSLSDCQFYLSVQKALSCISSRCSRRGSFKYWWLWRERWSICLNFKF